MKKILFAAVLISLCSCVDLKDVNTPVSETDVKGKITIQVIRNNEMISTKSTATEAESEVDSYSVFVFDVSSGYLQYREEGVKPSKSDPVAGKNQTLLGVHDVVLPTSGSKYVFAVANNGSTLRLPAMITIEEDPSNPTRLTDFRASARVQLTGAPTTPLAMVAESYMATSVDMKVPVVLSRAISKVQVRNRNLSAITLSSIRVDNATRTYFPFAQTNKYQGTVDYAAVTPAQGENAATFYILPSGANQMSVSADALLNGSPVSLTTVFDGNTYSDYDCKFDYTVNARGELTAKLYPSFGPDVALDPIELSGEWLSGKKEITLPYLAETTYGFTIDYILNVSGTAVLSRDPADDWYEATVISDSKIRLRTLKDNSSSQRQSTLTIKCNDVDQIEVTVKQQGLKDITTIEFNGLKWMDRNIGATARSNMSNAASVRAFGYQYQWGRNVPFPPCGSLEIHEGQMTPVEAMASTKFISYTSGTEDWNSAGIAGTTLDHWTSVSSNPCPEGYRLPTYAEIEMIFPYRANSLIFASGRQSRSTPRPDTDVKMVYCGYGSGAITEYRAENCIYGIVNYQTDSAYYMRWTVINDGGVVKADEKNGNVNYIDGGTNIVKIERIKADATANYASQKAAIEFWDSAVAEEEIYFVCAGRRDAGGEIQEAGNAAMYWTSSMYTNSASTYTDKYCSGLIYFRPAGKFMLMPAPAYGSAQVYYDTEPYGRRNQAFSLRCVKE